MQIALILFAIACMVAMVMIIWFKKNALVEYGRLFGLSRLLHLAEFKDMASNDVQLTYPKFLVTYWDNFATRLISCPVCLSVWIAGAATLPLFLILSLVFSTMLMMLLWPPTTLVVAYVSLYLYFHLVKMME